MEETIEELPHGRQSRFGSLQVRRVSRRRQQRNLDRAIALLLREFDLPDRAVLIVLALHDQDRHADMSKRVTKIPLTELRIEPGIAPVVKCIVRIGVNAGKLRAQSA